MSGYPLETAESRKHGGARPSSGRKIGDFVIVWRNIAFALVTLGPEVKACSYLSKRGADL